MASPSSLSILGSAGPERAQIEDNSRLVGGRRLGSSMTLRLRGGGPKKGKAKGAEQKLTPEELLLQEKMKQQAEADFKRRMAMMERERLREYMMIEKRNSRINQLKIQNQWRKVMRQAKVESLQKDIEVLSQNHERDVDRKDAIIQMLDRDLNEAEEQFQVALRSHLQNIDQLLQLQSERLKSLESEFQKDLKVLEEEFEAEKEEIVRQHAWDMTRLTGILEAIEEEEKARENEALQEHEQITEEIKNKNLDDINVLRITLDSAIEELEQKFETEHLNYLQKTDQRTQDFKYLTAKDQELSKEIEIKVRKIERLQANINHWRTKLTQNTKECAQRNQALMEEKEVISNHYHQLKNTMNRYREEQQRRLTDLANAAQKTKAALREKVELAERILKLGELARKKESEREKILPFFETTPQEETPLENDVEKQEINLLLRGPTDPDALSDKKLLALSAKGVKPNGEAVDEWHYLDLFWRRQNKAVVDQLALQKEKERLTQENQQLQSVLRQYLDGISVNESVLSTNNPLLVINGRVDLNRPAALAVAKSAADPTHVDANHMVVTNRVSTERM